MNFLKLLYRNIFGWKTSDLIEHMLETGRWEYHKYMCIAICSYLTPFWIGSTSHTNKIEARIDYYPTLGIFLGSKHTTAGSPVWPSRADERAFWVSFIEELRAKGE